MQTEIADDPFDAANANQVSSLLKLLRDDLGRSVRIQESMPNDLAHHLFGASIVGLWPACFALQSQCAVRFKVFQKLKIALLGITKSTGRASGSQPLALAFEKHGQLACDLVIVRQQD